MDKFLEHVARYYMSVTANHRGTTLVFPNKRSSLFMRRYLKRVAAGPTFLPRMVTLGSFMNSLSDLDEASRLEQLFTLYDAYVVALNEHGKAAPPFDKFRFWGEMLLDDFDDIDSQMVDADAIFKNVRDLHDISTDYLTEDQRAVAVELWGYDPRERYDRFWRNAVRIDEDGKEDRVYDQFTSLFDILGSVYRLFYAMLGERNLTTRGAIARHAAENIAEFIDSGRISGRIGFIGFDILSKSERTIFTEFRNRKLADFFWDVPVILRRDLPIEAEGTSIPLDKYIKSVVREFPMPVSFRPRLTALAPAIEIVSVPSNTMQAKVAGNILDKLNEQRLINDRRADDTAIVLPDSAMLIPMLHSLPESLGAVNITMGLPIRHTPFATLVSAIITMQTNGRPEGDDYCYLTENVATILTHPSMALIAPAECSLLRTEMDNNRRFMTSLSFIERFAPNLSFIFRPVAKEQSADTTGKYLTDLIDGMEAAIKTNATKASLSSDKYEIRLLKAYRTAINTITELIKLHSSLTLDLSAGPLTFFYLVEKLIRRENLNLSGSPLRGVQIMGALETRSLDFNNVIALSMNEKSFPPRNYMRSMIPSALRCAYGMTTVEEREMQYGWIFYNMVGRAHRVFLLYDTTSEAEGRGGKSRYLHQLENIFSANPTKNTTLTPAGRLETGIEITIRKDNDVVRAELDRFREGGDLNLSASALKNYMQCPLKFYLSNIKQIAEAKKPVEYIDAATQGSVAHRVLELLYKEHVVALHDSVVSGKLVIDRNIIERVVAEQLDKCLYFGRYNSRVELMPGEARMIYRELVKNIAKIIELEKKRGPYVFLAAEMTPRCAENPGRSFNWTINDNLTVRFTYSVDRVDRLDDGSLRFVDYKTGSDKLTFESVEGLFHDPGTKNNDAVFQLLTYAYAYNDFQASLGKVADTPIHIEIIKVFSPQTSVGVVPSISRNRRSIPLTCHTDEVVAGFRDRLNKLIEEIFDLDVPFSQSDDIENCRYCQFVNVCHRIVPDKTW